MAFNLGARRVGKAVAATTVAFVAVGMVVAASAVAGEPELGEAGLQPGMLLPAPPPGEGGLMPGEIDPKDVESGEVNPGPGLLSNHGCADFRGCFWWYNHYVGEKQFALPQHGGQGWLYYVGYSFASIKNRFANRRLRTGDAINGATRCTNPGGNRPTPPISTRFHVGNLGTRCN